jgi:hypothetical protein
MRDVTVTVKGITPYSASRPTGLEKTKSESHEEFDARIWREKAHFDKDGEVFIPGVSFKLALDEAASLMKEKIKGKGNQTYTGIIRTGSVAMSDMYIGVSKDELKPITIYANLDGRRGGGTRGNRMFPIVPTWSGEVTFRLFNDELPEEVFERYFHQAGLLTGVGRGRPVTGCPAGNGRFVPTGFAWGESTF